MSYYLITGGDKWTQVASVGGWGAFREWALGQDGTGELQHLVEHGWSQKLADLQSELEAAVKSGGPDEAVAGIGQAVIEALKARDEQAESAVLTDGLTSKDDPDQSGWTSEAEEPADAGSKKKGVGGSPEAGDAGVAQGGVLGSLKPAEQPPASSLGVSHRLTPKRKPLRRGGIPITRKQLHDLHVKRHEMNEKRMAKTLAAYFSGVVDDTCKALAKKGGTITAAQAEDPEKTAEKLINSVWDEDAVLESLVGAIKDPMANAFYDGAMTEYHLGKRAHKAIVERLQMKHLEGQHDQHSHAGEQETGGESTIPEQLRYTGPVKLRLYRAADDDFINADSTSFSESREAASAYRKNPGFGGENLYRTTVEVDPDMVLDLTSSDDPINDIATLLGVANPGAIGADEYVPRVADALLSSGVQWVRVNESYPEESITWIHLGGGADDPELTEIKADDDDHIFTKSTASDLLEELGMDWPEAFGTEPPPWLIGKATEALMEAFEEDYWLEIVEGTRVDLMATLHEAVREGVDMRSLAEEIQEIRGPDYAWWRAKNTAHTESGLMLNRGAEAGIEQTQEITGMPMGKEWNSSFFSTSRQNHMDFDATATDTPRGLFSFPCQDGEIREVRTPGDPSLPAADRCECKCFLLSTIVSEELSPDEEPAAEEDGPPSEAGVSDLDRKVMALVEKAASPQQGQAVILDGVADVRQPTNYHCGACAAMAVGRYFGVGPESLDEWAEALGTTEEKSTSPEAIVEYLTGLGLSVEAKHGMTLDDLSAALGAGRPVICPVQDYMGERSPKASRDYGHYLVVIGRVPGHVVVQDSSIENLQREPGGGVPAAEEDDSGNIAAPGRKLIEEQVWWDAWHDVGEDGTEFVRYGIVVGQASLDAKMLHCMKHLEGEHDQSSHAGDHVHMEDKNSQSESQQPFGKQFETVEDADKWAMAKFKKWGEMNFANVHPSVAAGWKRAIGEYQSGKSEDVNATLRGTEAINSSGISQIESQAIAGKIKHALERASMPEDVTVYRGIRGNASAFEVGKDYTDMGFASTSLAREHAKENYANPETGGSGVLMEIEVPKGTKAAYIDAIDRRSNGEAEVLLQRKTTFKVLGVRQEGGYTIVRTRVERQG